MIVLYLAAETKVGQSRRIDAVFSGTPQPLVWSVNGIQGGNATIGTIAPIDKTVGGPALYAAPASPPSPSTVHIKAQNPQNPSASASLALTITV